MLTLTDDAITFDLPFNGRLTIRATTHYQATQNELPIFLQHQQVIAVHKTKHPYDRVVLLQPTEFDLADLTKAFETTWFDQEAVGKIEPKLADYLKQVTHLLFLLGYQVTLPIPVKKSASKGKVRHRFDPVLAEIAFTVDYQTSSATVFWTKRDHLVIKAGAKLKSEAPKTKNGALKFSAKFGESLRQEQAANITNLQTTADITLKSVNEVGAFLYYGDTNSWLVLTDPDGKTIDEWSKVTD